MRSRLAAGALACLLVASPRVAAAAAGGGGAMHFFWEWANLLLLLGLIAFASRKPIMNYLAQRRQGIQDNLESAEQLLKSAEARLAEWNERAARLDHEVESIKDSARKSGETERQKIVADAQASAERIRQNAGAAVESEVRRARERLHHEAAELAVKLAEDILREKVTAEDQDRLVDEFIEQIEREGAN